MRFNTIFVLLVLYSLAGSVSAYGQENMGIAHDNYAPVNQHSLNPAAIVDSKVWLDIRLAGLAAYGRNNFVYLASSTMRKPGEFVDAVYDFNTKPNNMKAYADVEVMGPSASFIWKDHAFGLNIKAWASGLGRKIPMVLGEIAVTEGVEVVDTGLYKARNTRLKTMGWVEYGLSYGRILKKEAKNMFTAAVNLNRLIGVVDLNVIVRSASVTVVEDKGILNNLSGKFSYAAPLDVSTWKLGKGWGIDFEVYQSAIITIIFHRSRKFTQLLLLIFKDVS